MIIDRYKLHGHAPAIFYVNPGIEYCGKTLDPRQMYYVDQLDFNEDVVTIYDDKADTYYELLLTQGALCELVGFDNDYQPVYVGDTVEPVTELKKIEFEVCEGGVIKSPEYPNHITVSYTEFSNYHKIARPNKFIFNNVSEETIDDFKKEWLLTKNLKAKPGDTYSAFGIRYKVCPGDNCNSCAFAMEDCNINPYVPNCSYYGVHFEVREPIDLKHTFVTEKGE